MNENSRISVVPIICSRWLWLAVYIAVGALATVVLLNLPQKQLPFQSVLGWTYELPGPMPQLVRQCLSVVIGLLALLFAPLRWSHIVATLRYPTIWLAPIIASWTGFAIVKTAAWGDALLLEVFPVAFLEVVIGFLIALTILKLVHVSSDSLNSPRKAIETEIGPAIDTFEGLTEWLNFESPIETAKYAQFGAADVAKRIAKRFLKGRDAERDQTIGIVGPFGSGKTTLAKLVEEAVHENRNPDLEPEFWFAFVGCWDFEDGKAALHHILHEAVSEVSKRVDTLALRDLPDDYIDAFADNAGPVSAVFRRFAAERTPESRLQRLTPILAAMNARLILVIEDLDRGQNPEVAQQVMATLQRLKSVKYVSFILTGAANTSTSDTKLRRIDFAKLCDHVERIPHIRDDELRRILKLFRTGSRAEFPDIDPTTDERRNEILPRFPDFRYAISRQKYTFVEEALFALLETPRTLKHALRRTSSAWTQLHGEVDFDDLLCVNVLRFAAPDAFDYLVRNFDFHAGNLSAPLLLPGQEESEEFPPDAIWDEATENAEFNIPAAERLVEFLLPTDRNSRRFRKAGPSHHAPQGIRNSRPFCYFDRILAEAIGTSECRDQDVLRMIDQASVSGINELARCMFDSEQFSLQWQQWEERFPVSLLLPLASELFRLELEKNKSRASHNHDAHRVVWLRSLRHRGELTDTLEWLKSEIRRCVPVSIGFCNRLFGRWAGRLDQSIFVGDQSQLQQIRTEVRGLIWSEVKGHFENGKPADLLAVLNHSEPWHYEQVDQLHNLVLATDADGGNLDQLFRSPADWSWLAETTIAAARIDPGLMMPLIVAIFARERSEPKTRQPVLDRFDDSIIRGFFGSKANEAVELIQQHADLFEKSSHYPRHRVREITAAWLNEHATPP